MSQKIMGVSGINGKIAPMGIKRNCGSCGTKFYDMNKTPIICPKCKTEFNAEKYIKSIIRKQNSQKEDVDLLYIDDSGFYGDDDFSEAPMPKNAKPTDESDADIISKKMKSNRRLVDEYEEDDGGD